MSLECVSTVTLLSNRIFIILTRYIVCCGYHFVSLHALKVVISLLQLCLLLFSVHLILVSQLGLFSMYFILFCYVMLKLNLLFLFPPNSVSRLVGIWLIFCKRFMIYAICCFYFDLTQLVVWSDFGLYFSSVLWFMPVKLI